MPERDAQSINEQEDMQHRAILTLCFLSAIECMLALGRTCMPRFANRLNQFKRAARGNEHARSTTVRCVAP